MIRILIDDVWANYGPKNRRRKRLYTLEILNSLSEGGQMGYSVWLHDKDGIVIKRVALDVAFPEPDVLVLVTAALEALKERES